MSGKVVGINGSARPRGNTALLINAVFAELEEAGFATELVNLGELEIRGCKGCFACKGLRRCVGVKDDFNQ